MQWKYIKRLIVLTIVVAAIVALRFSGLGDEITLANLKQNADRLADFVARNYLLSVTGYIVLYIVVTGLSLPGAAVMTLAGGFLFGVLRAALYVNLGATLGATLAFLFARYVAGQWLQTRYADRLSRFNEELAHNGFSYLLTLRFIAVFPFWLVNLLAGLTAIRLRTFVWTTSVGILPGSIVYAYAGRQLATLESAGDIFTTRVLIAFLLLAILALVPTIINHVPLSRFKSRRQETDVAPGDRIVMPEASRNLTQSCSSATAEHGQTTKGRSESRSHLGRHDGEL